MIFMVAGAFVTSSFAWFMSLVTALMLTHLPRRRTRYLLLYRLQHVDSSVFLNVGGWSSSEAILLV